MKDLNSTQVEQLNEIIGHLRQLRQQQSIPTEEVAARTFIPLRLVKALEEGQLDQLPEPVFIQGFIRRYGDALGLDGSALAKTFPTSFLPIGANSNASSQEGLNTLLSSIPLYVPYILLLVMATSGLFYLISKSQAPESKPQPVADSVVK